jgi:hypothetical protein
MTGPASTGLTVTGHRLVLGITALSLAHHIDHVLRGVTGWPIQGGFNAFSGSLFVYPLIALGLALSRRGRAGHEFWILLAGGGALFILAVHLGPAAGDEITRIPDGYDSPVAGLVALVILVALFAALVAHCLYEARLLRR